MGSWLSFCPFLRLEVAGRLHGVTIWGVGAGGKELTYIVTIATTHMMNNI